MLAPSDFGLIAMIAVVTGFVEMFKDAGLSMATIQREKITHAQISTLFWINVALGFAVMLVVMALAPAVAWFYGEPRLTEIMFALSFTMLFGGMAVQHQALLRRRMEFGRLAVVELTALAAGVVTAVVMARQGYGYWSLVGMTAGTAVMTAVMSFALSGWMPGLPCRASGVGQMLAFGSNLAGANVFNYMTRNADNLIVGLMHGASALGIYSRGYHLFLMPLNQFLTPISAVAVPALARTTDRPALFRALLLQKSYFVVFFVALATGYSFCAAPELVQIVLGPGWEEAATIMRCLALGGAVYGTNVAGGWVCTTHGWTARQLRVAMFAGPAYALSYFVGSRFGPAGVAMAFSVTCCLLRYPVFKCLLVGSPISPGDLIRPLLRVGGFAALAAFAAMSVSSLADAEGITALAIKTGVYATIAAGLCAVGLLKIPRLSQRSAGDVH